MEVYACVNASPLAAAQYALVSGQPLLSQQRVETGRTAPEQRIGVFRVAAIAGGIDIFAQEPGQSRVEQVAGFLESGEAVGVERLRP